MGKDDKKEEVQEETALTSGLQVKEGEIIMGVCHIYASFNDTFVHVTDPSGRETLSKVTGGMKVKADRDEASPYAAMLAAQDVAQKCKDLGIGGLHIKMRATVRNAALACTALLHASAAAASAPLEVPPLLRRLSGPPSALVAMVLTASPLHRLCRGATARRRRVRVRSRRCVRWRARASRLAASRT